MLGNCTNRKRGRWRMACIFLYRLLTKCRLMWKLDIVTCFTKFYNWWKWKRQSWDWKTAIPSMLCQMVSVVILVCMEELPCWFVVFTVDVEKILNRVRIGMTETLLYRYTNGITFGIKLLQVKCAVDIAYGDFLTRASTYLNIIPLAWMCNRSSAGFQAWTRGRKSHLYSITWDGNLYFCQKGQKRRWWIPISRCQTVCTGFGYNPEEWVMSMNTVLKIILHCMAMFNFNYHGYILGNPG